MRWFWQSNKHNDGGKDEAVEALAADLEAVEVLDAEAILSKEATKNDRNFDAENDEKSEPALRQSASYKANDRQPQAKRGWFQRLTEGLSKSNRQVTQGISNIFTKSRLDSEMLEELEDLLIASDVGVPAAARITKAFAKNSFDRDISAQAIRDALSAAIAEELQVVEIPFELDKSLQPHVVLVVGVNGSGKTTTIGKLAHHMTQAGHSVMMAAGDTFRAAAIEQLKIWGDRTSSKVISANQGSDPAALAYDAVVQAKQDAVDLLLIDTAGRLHNKTDLMDELNKVERVIKKVLPEAPHSVLLVLDATIGQNALAQVKTFQETVPLSGLVVTKLDGTAKGGVLVALADQFKLPVHAIGVGESPEDLAPFSAHEYATALVGIPSTSQS